MFAEQVYVENEEQFESQQSGEQWQTQEWRNHSFCSPHGQSKDATGTNFS